MDLRDAADLVLEGIPKRVWAGYLLGVLATGVVLAAVYVYGNGPSLTGMEDFKVVDSMLFAVSGLTLAVAGGGTYYYFTRDLSTALAPLVGAVFSLYSGFEDIMVYVFCIKRNAGRCADTSGFPGKWTWLDSTHIGSNIQKLGLGGVTDFTLAVHILLFFIGSLILLKILVMLDYSFFGLEI